MKHEKQALLLLQASDAPSCQVRQLHVLRALLRKVRSVKSNVNNVNTRVEHRAAVVAEDNCRRCPCFRSYMDGSPGQQRGFIGDCTACRAEEPANYIELCFTGQIPCEKARP